MTSAILDRSGTGLPTGITAAVEFVTPGTAAGLLQRSVGNRNLRARRVDSYAATIAAGGWRLNGESIIVAGTGQLIDGHHRCQAVVNARMGIWSIVVRGVSPDVFATVDAGITRTAADALAISHQKNYARVAAAVRQEMTLSKHVVRTSSRLSEHVPAGAIVAYTQQHPRFVEGAALEISPGLGAMAPVGSVWSAIGGHIWEYGSDNARKAWTEFTERLRDGVGLSEGDPELALTRRLRVERGRTNIWDRRFLIIRAYNAHRAGVKLSKMVVGDRMIAPDLT